MLTSTQLINENIITNVPQECVAQVGIDLKVKEIHKMYGVGFIPATGKTTLPNYETLKWNEDGTIILTPGHYEVVFEQGCKFPTNVAGRIIHRSSLYRCGVSLTSPMFDPGYYCDNIGTFITVHNTIVLERGARLGQMVCFRTEETAEAYNGQWQNNVQWKESK